MFERLKKVFGQDPSSARGPTSKTPRHPAPPDVAAWAEFEGLTSGATPQTQSYHVAGTLGGKPWKMEVGRSSRDYIHGEELRARGELVTNEDAAVLVMSRPLKDALERRAYQAYTDTLQTTADPSLPEEMRWLAMYPEVGWDALPLPFWKRFSVMADQKAQAVAWLHADLAVELMALPTADDGSDIPFILMMLRGKPYLRMQYTPAVLSTLQQATHIFTMASQSAVANLSTDIPL